MCDKPRHFRVLRLTTTFCVGFVWLRFVTPARCDVIETITQTRKFSEISGSRLIRLPKSTENEKPSTFKVARCAQIITGAQRASFLSRERGKKLYFSILRAARK
jgi:hypothetical protein